VTDRPSPAGTVLLILCVLLVAGHLCGEPVAGEGHRGPAGGARGDAPEWHGGCELARPGVSPGLAAGAGRASRDAEARVERCGALREPPTRMTVGRRPFLLHAALLI
jgi:hypothetical protein